MQHKSQTEVELEGEAECLFGLDNPLVCLAAGTLGYWALGVTRSIVDLFGIICAEISGGQFLGMALVLRLCDRNYVFEFS